MAKVMYQQTVESTEALVAEWPRLGNLAPREGVRAGPNFCQSRGAEDFGADDETADAMLRFYNGVISDGRYVSLLQTDSARAGPAHSTVATAFQAPPVC